MFLKVIDSFDAPLNDGSIGVYCHIKTNYLEYIIKKHRRYLSGDLNIVDTDVMLYA